jgi:hypothetical protein
MRITDSKNLKDTIGYGGVSVEYEGRRYIDRAQSLFTFTIDCDIKMWMPNENPDNKFGTIANMLSGHSSYLYLHAPKGSKLFKEYYEVDFNYLGNKRVFAISKVQVSHDTLFIRCYSHEIEKPIRFAELINSSKFYCSLNLTTTENYTLNIFEIDENNQKF